jgi:hypothetical protein
VFHRTGWHSGDPHRRLQIQRSVVQGASTMDLVVHGVETFESGDSLHRAMLALPSK